MIRTDLPPLPARIAALPVDPDRFYPVPWFVSWIDGKPEFRCIEPEKIVTATRKRLCWVCGQPRKELAMTFVIGPMCAVNRISAEPPSHYECAEFSVKACPFLTKPQMVRRENDMPCGDENVAGVMIKRNPGCILLWTTTTYSIVPNKNGVLFNIGLPQRVSYWRKGRQATRPEILESMESGFPILMDMAKAQGPDAIAELERMSAKAMELVPA
jgi:hypothetical protein